MDKENAYYLLNEMEQNLIIDILEEWKVNRDKDNVYQTWKTVPANLLISEWRYYAKMGFTRDKNIDKIQDICIENTLKLSINTVLFGHTSLNPYSYCEWYINENMTEPEFNDWLDEFEWFACDKQGNWRISDYALDELYPLCADLLIETDYNTKLYLIDRMLNIVHPRSDLASWFVDGGSTTLSILANS